MLEVREHKMCVPMWAVLGFSCYGVFFRFHCYLSAHWWPRLAPVLLDSLSFSPPLLSSIPCSPHCFAGTAKGGTNREADTCLQSQPKELLLLNYIGWCH